MTLLEMFRERGGGVGDAVGGGLGSVDPIGGTAPIGATVAAAEGVLFPRGYSWLVLAGSLDVIMTYLMLNLGAIEVNLVADRAIQAAGLWGLIALKFMALGVVLGICEFVGRRRLGTARTLVTAGVALNFAPVALSLAQLVIFFEDWVGSFVHG